MIVSFPRKKTVQPSRDEPIVGAPLVAFDLETSGLYIERGARPWEFAIIDRGGLRLGWTAEARAHAGLSLDLLRRVFAELGQKVVVGHNIGFDLKFLAAEATRHALQPPPLYCVDTLGLSQRLLAAELTGFTLREVASHLGCTVPGTLHRAEPDARLTLAVFDALCARFDLSTLADAGLQRFVL